MTVVDYSRSYVTFHTKGRGNNARLMIEARCQITTAGGAPEEYYFFASCKSEHTFADRNLFHDPNYDFCGIFSQREFHIFRTPASREKSLDTFGPIEGTFEGVTFQLNHGDAELLSDIPAIVKATLAGRPLVGQTEIEEPRLNARVLFEYPIKTMNVNDQKWIFQVDTGPIPYPDADAPGGTVIERMRLAFVAFNRFDIAEFILQQPTPIVRDGREVCQVLHYSGIRELAATNRVLAL